MVWILDIVFLAPQKQREGTSGMMVTEWKGSRTVFCRPTSQDLKTMWFEALTTFLHPTLQLLVLCFFIVLWITVSAFTHCACSGLSGLTVSTLHSVQSLPSSSCLLSLSLKWDGLSSQQQSTQSGSTMRVAFSTLLLWVHLFISDSIKITFFPLPFFGFFAECKKCILCHFLTKEKRSSWVKICQEMCVL